MQERDPSIDSGKYNAQFNDKETIDAIAWIETTSGRRWWKQTNMPRGETKTLENFTVRPGTEEALKAVERFIRGEGAPILTLSGPTGSGKTHLAQACMLAVAAIDDTDHPAYVRSMRYEHVPESLQDVRDSFTPRHQGPFSTMDIQQAHSLSYLLGKDLVVLDDLGAEKMSDWTADVLEVVIDGRYRDGMRTIITTNWILDDILDGVYRRLASRIFDSHTGSVEPVYLTCSDYRLRGVKGRNGHRGS